MSLLSSSRIVLIHTRETLSMACENLMRASVLQARASEGCVDCDIRNHSLGRGHWIISAAWESEDSMRAGFERVFKPAFENLISSDALFSIRVCEAQTATDLLK